MKHGRWPKHCVLHRCDVRLCVRDDHLFEGTKADNNRDRAKKDRNGVHRPRLAPEVVKDIRHRSAEGESYPTIMSRYAVGASCVSNIVNRKTWRHL